MKILGIAVALLLVLLGIGSVYVVGEGQQAILLGFGQVVRDDVGPGVHLKLPLLQQVVRFDDRSIVFDPSPERSSTADGQIVELNYELRWHVLDRARYYRATDADAQQADQRLIPLVREALRGEVGSLSLPQLLAADATTLAAKPLAAVDAQARSTLGIAVSALVVKRISLPDSMDAAIYKRMREAFQAQAAALRAQGTEQAAKLKADADSQAQQIRADAMRQASIVRGQGDAKAAAIYAQAYQQDPDFYAFYRSLAVYRHAFGGGRGTIVLKGDSSFLRYFGDPGSAGKSH